MKLKIGIILLGLFLLNACANKSVEPSMAEIYKQGYSDIRIYEDMWMVRFDKISNINNDQVEDFILLRSAEITLEHGYNYFVIINNKTSIMQGENTSYYNYPLDSRTIKIVKMLKNINNKENTYDAKSIVDTVKSKYSFKDEIGS